MDRKMEKLPIVTTNMEIYKQPKHLPGYTGHVPQLQFDHAETYGNSSARILSEYRAKKLDDSTLGMKGRGGDAQIPFPTYYDNDPSRVIGTRPRTWEKWRPAHSYEMFNTSSREEELRNFNMAAQLHRDHYKDHSQTRPKINTFDMPNISHPTTNFPGYRTNCHEKRR